MSKKGIELFNNTVKELNRRFKSQSTYTIWIKLELIHNGKSVVFNSNTNENSYIVSVSNTKFGDEFGVGDQVDISMCYAPKPESINNSYDISFIDRILASDGGGTEDFCSFNLSYGYDFTDKLLRTMEYKGIINTYTVSVSNGMLMYSLQGTTTVNTISEARFDFEPVQNARYTDVAQTVLNDKLSKLGYDVVFDTGVQGSDAIVDYIDGASDMTVFEYVDSLLKRAVDVNQAQSTDVNVEDKITYTYTIDNNKNSNGKSTITICRNNPTLYQQDSVIVFNWMAKGDNLVTDFSTSFDGTVLMTAKYCGSNKEFATIDSNGNMVYVNGVPQRTVGGGDIAKSDADADMSSWADQVNAICNQAQMSLIGIPCEIPITTVIKIVPLIYGVPHYSAGYYEIDDVTDRISASGYITELKLTRVNAKVSDKDFSNIYNLYNS